MRRTALVLVPLLIALCACTGGSGARSSIGRVGSATPSASAAAHYLWERTDLKPATRPELVGGRVVMYTQDGTFLSVTALDPATGKTVWSRRATDALITGGVAFGLTTIGKNVVFLEPAPSRGRPLAQVSAVDAATGRQVWSGDTTALYLDMPTECDGDTTALCASGGIDLRGTGIVRISKRDGSITLLPVGDRLRRAMGDELYDTGERKPDYAARVMAGGRQVWKRPLAAMFGADVSSDTGWDWHLFGSVNVGSMGLRKDRALLADDAAAWVQVGVDQSTGRTLWRSAGRQLKCLGALDDVLVKGEDLPYRCADRGTLTYGKDRHIDARHVSAVVEGFDPKTGRTTWSVDAGLAPALASGTPGAIGLGGATVAIPRPGRATLKLDLRTGAHSELSTPVAGWCAVQNPYPLSTSAATDAVRQGETLQVPCRSDGGSLTTPPPGITGFAVQAGGALVWGGRDGIHAVAA